MTKITFTPVSEWASELLNPPKPASQFIPNWYKEMPSFLTSSSDAAPGLSVNNARATNSTVKHCPPFLDSLTSGYIWALPVDIEARKNSNGLVFLRWRTDGEFISPHSDDQIYGLPKPVDGEQSVMKWSLYFKINTPPGYSTMFTHPFNRHDLPFRTFTGIVETDSFPLAVEFPFQFLSDYLVEDKPMIISKGTPVVQMIPFKRENWKSSIEKVDDRKSLKSDFAFFSTIAKSYKDNFWKKKIYK